MKRKCLIVFTAVLLVVLTVFCFAACNKKKKDIDLSGNISYAETHKYTGSDADFRACVTIGIKEKLFIADGNAQEVSDFAAIAVTPLKNNLLNKEYSFTLAYEGGEISGTLTRDVVTHAYSANVDIGDFKDKLIALTVIYDDKSSVIELADKLADKISYTQVLEIAKGELGEQIDAALTDGKLPREICIKLIKDKRNPDSPFYWYISFIAADNNYWALLLDPETGEVVTKKN